MGACVRLENLKYIYNQGLPSEKVAIDGVSLTIDSGEFVGIIGHTGSGKSTLVQHLNGLLKPTAGKVYIDDVDFWASKEKLRELRFKVGLVFQYPEYQLFEETVYRDIAFGPTNMGLSVSEIDERVKAAANAVGLSSEVLERSPFNLSGGQKRRVAIAGVLAMRPEVLILDEPASGLDPKGREEVLGMISDYHKEIKNTVILISHSMDDIATYANKVVVINEGKIFDYDTVKNIFLKSNELKDMGLSVPSVTNVMLALEQKGVKDIDTSAFNTAQAAKELIRILKHK